MYSDGVHPFFYFNQMLNFYKKNDYYIKYVCIFRFKLLSPPYHNIQFTP